MPFKIHLEKGTKKDALKIIYPFLIIVVVLYIFSFVFTGGTQTRYIRNLNDEDKQLILDTYHLKVDEEVEIEWFRRSVYPMNQTYSIKLTGIKDIDEFMENNPVIVNMRKDEYNWRSIIRFLYPQAKYLAGYQVGLTCWYKEGDTVIVSVEAHIVYDEDKQMFVRVTQPEGISFPKLFDELS